MNKVLPRRNSPETQQINVVLHWHQTLRWLPRYYEDYSYSGTTAKVLLVVLHLVLP